MGDLQDYEARIATVARLDFTPDEEWHGPYFPGETRDIWLREKASAVLHLIAADIRRKAWHDSYQGWAVDVARLAEQEARRLIGDDWQARDDSVMDHVREWLTLDPRTDAQIGASCRPPLAQAQINRIRNGDRANPSIETIARLLPALGRRWADLDAHG